MHNCTLLISELFWRKFIWKSIRPILAYLNKEVWYTKSLTSHSTQYRSFRRRGSNKEGDYEISWLCVFVSRITESDVDRFQWGRADSLLKFRRHSQSQNFTRFSGPENCKYSPLTILDHIVLRTWILVLRHFESQFCSGVLDLSLPVSLLKCWCILLGKKTSNSRDANQHQLPNPNPRSVGCYIVPSFKLFRSGACVVHTHPPRHAAT